MRGTLRLLPLTFCFALPLAAHAEKHALLIGVSRIAALDKKLWLQGVGNDLVLMRRTLLASGFSAAHIAVLADAVPHAAGRPTRAAIERAVAVLEMQVKPQDDVVLYFAGHGLQVPQRAGTAAPESDGLDEVFLTADVQRWNATEQRLPKAVMDDDIGGWIDGLVDRGARVWAVFDTCHAMGMSRGAPAGGKPRGVLGHTLGVPAAHTTGLALMVTPAPRLDGRVLLFAARAHEATVEDRLQGASGQRVHGVFTHALTAALQAGARTVDELQASVRQQYRAAGRRAPVPVFVGDGQARWP